MTKEFVFAGFGGQGVLTAGMILAYSGAAKDLDVTWIPSYGSEMRGGTANCTVKLLSLIHIFTHLPRYSYM